MGSSLFNHLNIKALIRTTSPLKLKSDIEKLLTVEGRDGLYFHFGLFTALRVSEILSLKWGQVIQDGSVLREITISRSKKRKENQSKIGLSDILRKRIQAYYKGQSPDDYIFRGRVRGNHLTKEAVNLMIKKRLSELSIVTRHPTSHALRKTFAKNFHEQRVKAGDVQALSKTTLMLGKTSERDTLRYIGVEEESLVKDFQEFNYI